MNRSEPWQATLLKQLQGLDQVPLRPDDFVSFSLGREQAYALRDALKRERDAQIKGHAGDIAAESWPYWATDYV